jgi:transcriptional regulator
VYIPASNAETDLATLHQMMRDYNFAMLVSNGDPYPQATQIPFMVDETHGEFGTLISHMARANPHWKSLSEETPVLVMFQGPHSYISPRWYAAESLVPTWNYAAIHAYGKPRLIHDAARLKEIVMALVHFHEGAGGLPGLDERFPETLLQAIVGMEMPIERLEGKMKFNQNKSVEDQQGVIAALIDSEDSTQRAVAQIMQRNVAALKRSRLELY